MILFTIKWRNKAAFSYLVGGFLTIDCMHRHRKQKTENSTVLLKSLGTNVRKMEPAIACLSLT
jgi:hypothetical protein